MTPRAVGQRPLLTLGRVDVLRVQVGYRARPDGPAYQHFLLDVPVPEPVSPDDEDSLEAPRVLTALEPALYVGSDAPRHYSLHQHRWHTSWGASPGALEIGLLVTAGTRTAALSTAAHDAVVRAFRNLLELVGRPEPSRIPRDAAILRARRSAATAYAVDPDALWLSEEEHHASQNCWTVGLRTAAGDEYDVVIGVVDGYAGSVRVRQDAGIEVYDSVGSD